ncbi:hypothetical protein Tco_1077400 [Tanacetum coccineum]
MPRKKFNVLAQHLQETMEESLPIMVDNRVKELTKTQVPVYVAHGLIMERQQNQVDMAKMIVDVDSWVKTYMSDNPQLQQDDLPIWLAFKYKFKRLYVATTPCRPSDIFPRDQDDPHKDAPPEGENSAKRQKTYEHGTFVFGESSSNDNEIPTEKVSQELVNEMSQTVDESKLRKVVKEMKEILVLPHPQKPTSVVQSCQRDPKAPTLSLVNQYLFYLKKGNSGLEKIMLSLHKFPAIIFSDDDIEERTSRWVDKCIKKFNPYARYSVNHWKNPHAKIFYIKKQREPGNLKEHNIITKLDYKNLNKNDIEDMYLLIVNNKVDDYAETGLLWSLCEKLSTKVNLTTPTITFQGIEKYKIFFVVSEPVYGIIYKNIKKEKRVIRHQEVHKFCDATLKRILEGLKSYNNDVKHGYVTPSLSNEDVEYLQLFEEEIEKWLKHHD